jgi:hypothetical protein
VKGTKDFIKEQCEHNSCINYMTEENVVLGNPIKDNYAIIEMDECF